MFLLRKGISTAALTRDQFFSITVEQMTTKPNPTDAVKFISRSNPFQYTDFWSIVELLYSSRLG